MLRNGFDIDNLKPTFNLLIGVPGKSNAFSISKRLGVSNSIIERAKSLMDTNDISIEELLKNIYDNKELIEKEKMKIENDLQQIEHLKNTLEKEKLDLDNNKSILINKAKDDARKILLDAKEEVNSTIRRINEIYNNIDTSSIKELSEIRNNLNKTIKEASNNTNSSTISHFSINDLQVGMKVSILNASEPAIITSIFSNKENKVQVEVGNIKLTIPVSSITKIINKQDEKISRSGTASFKTSSKAREATTELNVIGCNVEEAIFLIDKYLDDCALAKLKTVRLVHGKGTGALRNGIHNFLKTNSHVANFRLGTFGEGETGVTVVELK